MTTQIELKRCQRPVNKQPNDKPNARTYEVCSSSVKVLTYESKTRCFNSIYFIVAFSWRCDDRF